MADGTGPNQRAPVCGQLMYPGWDTIMALKDFADSTPSPASDSAQDLQEPEVETKAPAEAPPAVPPWPQFIQGAKTSEIKSRLSAELLGILQKHGLDQYCALAVLEPEGSIDSYDLDRIFSGLSAQNPDRTKDVMLLLLAAGGTIEPAYQISKLCKSFASRRFTVVVPRRAKSAATLIAIGADEIHMGPLSQLARLSQI
jgi:hypothetical protein